MKTVNKLGETNKNKESLGGYEMKIIEYNNMHDIIIEFQDEHKAKVHTNYSNFLKGSVKNPYHPNVYGVGYLGQGKYKCSVNNKTTKAYEIWTHMLKRCYDPYFINKEITYKDCYVCKEWHNFQNFAKWFYKHYYEISGEKMCLDKDILVKRNKIYSPETCIIVPRRINILFTKNDINRGRYPIGTTEVFDKRNGNIKLYVRCSIYNKEKNKKERVSLGYFPTSEPFHAFYTYKQFKESYIKQVADEYKDLIPSELYNALYKWEVDIND